MPRLEHLELNEYPGGKLTDRGLEVLRHLPFLRTFSMAWQRGISDAGAANLRYCERLESVNLMGSPTGDGAVAAMRGKPALRRFGTGRLVTDEGLALLHEFPRFRSFDGVETHLLIDGPFTDKGIGGLAGLDGVWELDLFRNVTRLTPDAFGSLRGLPNLTSLGCDGELSGDRAMAHISTLPRLRKLRAQGSVATGEGFEALSRSVSLEQFWGRECPNFTGRSFVALSRMPSLRALGVGCRNVDDESLAALPSFPALRELTPIGVTDAGFRHVGCCVRLERLSCMYCRETTDAATEHIADLRLKSYYAGLTQITDRSLEILARMESLESIELYETRNVTTAGLVHLAALPRLRELRLSGLPQVGYGIAGAFPARVRVEHDV
jgi:hypothetical protein